MESWADFINGLDFELPEGIERPLLESDIPKEEPKETKRVHVQKIITEVWIYSDLKNKTLGTQAFQDVSVLGEMDIDTFAGMISKRKAQRRRKR